MKEINSIRIIDSSRPFEERLLDELLAVQASMNGDGRATSSRRRHRIILAVAVAAAAVGVVVFQTLPGSYGSQTSASAAQFLRHAASTVVKAADAFPQTAVLPQPNQFVYTKTEDANGDVTQSWLSVTGTSAGEVQSTGASPEAMGLCTIAQAEATGCQPEVGYYSNMPTQPDALLTYLQGLQIIPAVTPANETTNPNWQVNSIAKAVMYLLETTYVTPAQQAALYDLMANTQGFTLAQDVSDVLGQSGVGIEWTYEGSTSSLIFNPTTYAFLGTNSVANPGPGNGSALIRVSIVNQAGQLPGT